MIVYQACSNEYNICFRGGIRKIEITGLKVRLSTDTAKRCTFHICRRANLMGKLCYGCFYSGD